MNTHKLKEAQLALDTIFRELRSLRKRYTGPVYVPEGLERIEAAALTAQTCIVETINEEEANQ
jgi:hypothetical protein